MTGKMDWFLQAKHAFTGNLSAAGLVEAAPPANGSRRVDALAVEAVYAASMDWAVRDELRLGIAAFGDLGTSRRFGGRQEHFLGPEVKFDSERLGPGEIEVEAGWLKAFGAARDQTAGQARLLLGYEFHL